MAQGWSRQGPRRRTTTTTTMTTTLACIVLLASTATLACCHQLADETDTSPAPPLALSEQSITLNEDVHDAGTASVHRRTKRAELGSTHPTSIPITGKMPSTVEMSETAPKVYNTWTAALHALSSAAEDLVQATLGGPEFEYTNGKVRGVPGTGIDSITEAKALQRYLDCMTSRGEWVLDEQGTKKSGAPDPGLTVHKQEGIYASCDKRFYKSKDHLVGDNAESAGNEWDVRSSLKWRWVTSAACADSAPPNAPKGTRLSRRRLCRYLSHKSTLLVGDTPQYSLHDVLLDWTTVAPLSCYGDLYCREHSLCNDILSAKPEDGIEDWAEDERVWTHLPPPPTGLADSHEEMRAFSDDDSDTAPTGQTMSPSMGTMLRYRRSDGLRSGTKHVNPTFTHPSTGVREMNQQWIADSRRSDIVIVSKSPLPFPLLGHNSTFDTWFSEAEQAEDPIRYAQRFIEAAWQVTRDVWLPELVDTLRLMRGSPSPEDQLIVYRGGWRSHHDCARSQLDEDDPSATWDWNSPGDGPPPHLRSPSLSRLIFRDRAKTRLVDRHTLWFNLQTILQNHIVRTQVTPKFGIPFLDLESGMSVWRSGMVGGSASQPFTPLAAEVPQFVDQSGSSGGKGASVGMRSAASGDCTRYCIASPGSGIEEAFIGGLIRIFERGWGSTKTRRETWTGDGYLNVKKRAEARRKAKEGLDDE